MLLLWETVFCRIKILKFQRMAQKRSLKGLIICCRKPSSFREERIINDTLLKLYYNLTDNYTLTSDLLSVIGRFLGQTKDWWLEYRKAKCPFPH